MNMVELDSDLSNAARKLLHSSSNFRGLPYLKSPLKRNMDRILGSFFAATSCFPLGWLNSAVYISDRHLPLVNTGQIDPVTGLFVPIWKIRTMIPNAQAQEFRVTEGVPLNKLKLEGRDPRITTIGKPIRKTGLDELPQLYSVICGKLSLVGPRIPSVTQWPGEVTPYADIEPYQEFMAQIKSGAKYGITGLYALLGREKLDMPERIALEAMYGRDATFVSDLRMIALTVTPHVIRRKDVRG